MTLQLERMLVLYFLRLPARAAVATATLAALLAGCAGGSGALAPATTAVSASSMQTLGTNPNPNPSTLPSPPVGTPSYQLIAPVWVDADDLPGRLDLYVDTRHRDDDDCHAELNRRDIYRTKHDIVAPLHATYTFVIPCLHDESSEGARRFAVIPVSAPPPPTPTPTSTPTPTPTSSPTPSPTPSPTTSPTPVATATPGPSSGYYLIAIAFNCARGDRDDRDERHDRDDCDGRKGKDRVITVVAGPAVLDGNKGTFASLAPTFEFKPGVRYAFFIAKQRSAETPSEHDGD